MSDERCSECWSNDEGRAWIHRDVPMWSCECPCHANEKSESTSSEEKA
jgi:hypothetical protein